MLYRPWNSAGRFSRNELMPSAKSLVPNSCITWSSTWWVWRGEVLGEAVAVEALHGLDGERRVGGDLVGPRSGGGDELVVGARRGSRARGARTRRRRGRGRGSRSRTPWPSRRGGAGTTCRRTPGTTPRLAKPGRSLADGGHEPEVAAEGEVEAVAGGGAVDGGDHRRVHLVEHDGGQVAGVAETAAALPSRRRRCRCRRRRPGGRGRSRTPCRRR